MKIAIVNKHREDVLGGSEIQCDFIANELTNRGHQVRYIVPVKFKNSTKSVSYSYEIKSCDINSQSIFNEIEVFKPDIVYWRFNKKKIRSTFRKIKKLNIPIIFAISHINDLKTWVYSKRRRFHKRIIHSVNHRIEHFGFKYVDAVVVNNESFLNRIPSNISINKFIPNGMDNKIEPFHWSNPYCVWVANIKLPKRPELYIKLAKQFEGSGIDFLMVGAIQQKSYSWIMSPEKTPENFHYLGPKSLHQVNGILNKSLLHIHTCIPEGFPNIFIQAWLQAVPSVTYGFDPSNYIRENELGYSADENWELFVKYVTEIIDRPEKRNEFSNNTILFASKKFQLEKSIDELENIFSKLLLK